MKKWIFLLSCLLVLLGVQVHAASSFNLAAVATTTTVWATAYQVNVTLTNNTTQPSSAWTAQFTLPSGNTLSTHVTNGVFTTSGQVVTVTNTVPPPIFATQICA